MEQPNRRYRAVALIALCLLLAGCKSALPPGLPGMVSGLADGAGEDDALQEVGLPPPGGPPATIEALARHFVASFAPLEAEARRLRTEDPRYLVQDNVWRGAGERTYRSYPLASARFEYAHAAGLTGAGQTVAVVDSGFLPSHEVFAGTPLVFPLEETHVAEHGTAVASIVAGSSPVMQGGAPGATLMLSSFGTTARLAAATRAAASAGAVAQNNSWGFRADAGQAEFRSILQGTDYLDALTDYAARGVVVFAAPNDRHRTQATLMEALPRFVPELEAGWIAVVNAVPDFDGDRVRSAELLSSPCLGAARWCIAADGAWVAAGSASPSAYVFATGTSFAAPQVAAALALLGEAFPDLPPHALRARLLASADNGFFAHDGSVELAPGFFHGYSEVFGHGFLDLRAALLPIGTPVLPLASGRVVPADRPVLVTGRTVGPALTADLASRQVVVTDALGGGFRMAAGALAVRPSPPPLVTERLAGIATAGGAPRELRDDAGALALMPGTHFAMTAPDGGLALDIAVPANGTAADFALALRGGDRDRGLRLGVGLMHDVSGALGVSGLARGRAAWAAALDVEARMPLGPGAALTVFGQAGMRQGVDPVGFADISPSRFTGFGASLTLENTIARSDRLTLGVAFPTAVRSGSARITLPVAMRSGVPSFDTLSVDLAPEAREMRLSVGYRADLGGGWSLNAEALHAVNYGHVAGAAQTGAVIGLSARF